MGDCKENGKKTLRQSSHYMVLKNIFIFWCGSIRHSYKFPNLVKLGILSKTQIGSNKPIFFLIPFNVDYLCNSQKIVIRQPLPFVSSLHFITVPWKYSREIGRMIAVLEPLIFICEEFSLDLPFIDMGQVHLNNLRHFTDCDSAHNSSLPNLSQWKPSSTIIPPSCILNMWNLFSWVFSIPFTISSLLSCCIFLEL